MRAGDTAGVPWAGRRVTDTGFGADDGAADPAVRDALRSLAGTRDPVGRAAAETHLVRLLRTGRVLVPVVASPAEVEGSTELAANAGAQLATLAITAPDGRRGLPVFTGLDCLAAGHPRARPVPVAGVLAARAALEDACDALLVDLGAPAAAVLRLSHICALAEDRDWLPAHLDPVVTAGIAAATRDTPGLAGARAQAGPAPGVLGLVLEVGPGLDAAQVEAVATDVAGRLAGDPEVRCRLDEVAVTLRAAARARPKPHGR